MGRNFAISLAFHMVLFIVAYVGLPTFRVDTEITDVPISVEIVNVSDVTNMPTKPKKPTPVEKVAPKPPPKPPAPPPAPQGSVQEPPAPEPIPEAPPEQVAILVQPDAKPKAKEKPKPKDEPKKADSKKRSPAPLPPRKPQPPKAPDTFASVLKTLEELKQAPPPAKKEPEMDFAKMMENALETDKVRTDVGPELTISEIDLVRQQIHRCWNLPAGAKDAHTMLISIRISMNPDGTVRTARILDQSRMSSNPFYRAMAESALRAVSNPICQPFKLPPEKFDRWKNMKLNFDPKDMFGL